MAEKKDSVKRFESEPGKTVTMIKLGGIVIKTEMCATTPCELPIDEWRSIPLEIPSDGIKKHLLGRFPGGIEYNSGSADPEVINLPVYTGEEVADAEIFERFSNNPESIDSNAKIPVMTITTKACGRYSDGRKIQSVNVLPIWSDDTSIVLELDWSEGNPAEDAINPEWYLRASPRLSIIDGLQKLRECSRIHPLAEECSYHIYVNPCCLGKRVLGEGQEYPSKIWQREWKFDRREEMIEALSKLLEAIGKKVK